jgi:DNA-binding response OmpR family regulator
MNDRILIVDDNRDNIRLFQQILMDQGYRVFVALSGPAALSSITEEIPDLILLDIMMPEMDGFTVCREIKKQPRLAEIPVLFLSARNEIVDEMQGFSCGAVDYITKPVSVPILLARVRTHLNLKDVRSRLERQNEELEMRVRERTAHLEKALEEKRLLLGEVHHRVLNNLQFIAGLIILQMESLDDKVSEPLLAEYENRIHSMAMVHQELYGSRDFMEVDLVRYACSLFRFHAAKNGHSDESVVLENLQERAVLNINFAIPCGLILNEFFSLCFRHSPAGVMPGAGFRLDKDSVGGGWIMRLYGTGGSFISGKEPADAFPIQVIHILVSQIRGELRAAEGGCWEIQFPDTAPITYSDVSALA